MVKLDTSFRIAFIILLPSEEEKDVELKIYLLTSKEVKIYMLTSYYYIKLPQPWWLTAVQTNVWDSGE